MEIVRVQKRTEIVRPLKTLKSYEHSKKNETVRAHLNVRKSYAYLNRTEIVRALKTQGIRTLTLNVR